MSGRTNGGRWTRGGDALTGGRLSRCAQSRKKEHIPPACTAEP
jgi:hypothetical protein